MDFVTYNMLQAHIEGAYLMKTDASSANVNTGRQKRAANAWKQ